MFVLIPGLSCINTSSRNEAKFLINGYPLSFLWEGVYSNQQIYETYFNRIKFIKTHHCAGASTTSQAKTVYVNGGQRQSRIPQQISSAVKKNNTHHINGQQRPNSSNAKKVSMTQSRSSTRTTKPPHTQPATLKAVH